MSSDLNAAGVDAARSLALPNQLARMSRGHRGRNPALSYLGRSLSFRELDARVTKLAVALFELGVRKGDRVAVLAANRPETVEVWFAAQRLGAIAVPLNTRLVAAEVAYILADSGAKILVVDEVFAEVGLAARTAAGSTCGIICRSEDPDHAPLGTLSYHRLIEEAGTEFAGTPVADSDPAFIIYTSGTTGRPKGAVLSHLNLFVNSLNSADELPILATDRSLLSVPMFHIAAVNTVINALVAGACTVIDHSTTFAADHLVDLLESEQITICFLVPTQWKQVCELPGITDRKLALRRISWGASGATASVLEAMNATFPDAAVISAFGQTETSCVTTLLRGEDAVRKLGSVGRPVRHVDVRIVDEQMRDVPTGSVGEIVYRGATVMQGYWNKPDATDEAFAGGWFHSGDLCRMDDEGFVYVVDRKKDMIVSGGENIYSAEVEAAIDSHPKVREVAVVGVAHPKWVETPRAFIVPTDPADPPTTADIVEHCATRLASFKKPTSVVVLDALPRNASGKVLKIRLRNHGHPAPLIESA
ncbi:long-chain-fatty-acid--CoA ligase [Rhodococcus opacus]|uniref:long-chain-fatty-acid--CoA ligase n=1 Tax=Rhodococcus opacus TaxID=37919 RepID=UPI001C440378|nr:long-chain-fatty-acid--CoA ligase [Rhodococcus opacus]MBV6754892.1 long-chain-fatty-acid--CoA ligase [Rhodococcus opacus]